MQRSFASNCKTLINSSTDIDDTTILASLSLRVKRSRNCCRRIVIGTKYDAKS